MTPAEPQEAGTGHEARTGEQRIVVFLLRAGLIVAVLLFVAGSLLALGSSEGAPAVTLDSFRQGGPLTGSLVAGAGVLVLAATPLVRVLSLLALWTKERDYRYAFVAAFVAFVLFGAILSGHGG